MPPIRNITRGGGKAWKAEVANLKEMQLRFADIGKTIDGSKATIYQRAAQGLNDAFTEAAHVIRNTARNLNISRNGSWRVRAATFAFTDFDAVRDPKRKRSTLVGVRTGAPPRFDRQLFRVWGVGSRRRKDNSIAHRGLGMSLGRIIESGTRFVRGKRFFRDAIFSTRSRVLGLLADAYGKAVKAMSD